MHRFRREGNEIPEGVVRARRLRKTAVRFHFYGMDEIGELDGILNEEDRDVVTDQIPVAFLSIELHGKAAYISGGVHGARATRDRRNTSKHGRFLTHLR